MAKFLVEGIVRFSFEVEADSEDEALEMGEENFDFETHVSPDSLPEFTVANPVGGVELGDDDDEAFVARGKRYNEDEDDDN